MGQCNAKYCSEDDLDDTSFFCQLHWDILPQTSKDKLVAAYGTEEWVPVLKIVVQELILAEGDYIQSSQDQASFQGPSGEPGQAVPPPAKPPKRARNVLRPPTEPPKRQPGIGRDISEDVPE